MSCPHAPSCPLYPLFTLKSLLSIWKAGYCEGKYSECARYQRSCAGTAVPLNLLPNGKLLDANLLPRPKG